MPKLPVVERRYLVAFALTSTLFFAWGLASQFNDLLLHHFQKALDLTRPQASLTQFAFYIGYFCAPLPAAMIIRRLGYKKTMIIGLALYAIGAFLFVPAAHMRIYGIFLAALYIIAIGAGFLETSANPYIAIMGAPETASPRLNFAQAFNGVATVLGPLVGGYVIFSGVEYTPAQMAAMGPAAVDPWRAQEAAAVGPPYLVLGILMVVIASAIALTRYPPLRADVTPEGSRLALRGAGQPARSLCRDRAILLCRRPGRHLEPAGGFRAGSRPCARTDRRAGLSGSDHDRLLRRPLLRRLAAADYQPAAPAGALCRLQHPVVLPGGG